MKDIDVEDTVRYRLRRLDGEEKGIYQSGLVTAKEKADLKKRKLIEEV